MLRKVGFLAAILVLAAGCQAIGFGTRGAPAQTDYRRLPTATTQEVDELLARARRFGAELCSPYEYYSAREYRARAADLRARGDRRGARDYIALAGLMAEKAVRNCAKVDDAPRAAPDNSEACRSELSRIKGLFRDLNKEKAIQAAPAVYARLTTTLAFVERTLQVSDDWRTAGRALGEAEADLAALLAHDADGDGVVDMQDGAPFAAEDVDNYEDEDGIPDLDNDHDGIPDAIDVAPLEPETVNRWQDYDGAPDAYPVLECVPFESGSADLSAEAEGYLRGLCLVLTQNPDLKLRIKGHADDARAAQESLQLSRRRGEEVQQYLVANGVSSSQVVVTYHGANEPIGDNATPEGRAQNRRVDLLFE